MLLPKAQQHTTVRHTAARAPPAAERSSDSGGGATALASGATPDARASEAPTAAPEGACGSEVR